ncbi:MAG: ABC transporter permease [Thermoplasmatota archaeon]
MAIRWEDIREKVKELLNEFKGQKVGMVGLGIIVFLLLVGIFAPILAPGITGNWENTDKWRDHPKGVPPTWWNYLTSDELTPQTQMNEPDSHIEQPLGRFEENVVYYNYTYNNDEPPTNLALYLDATFDNTSDARSLQVECIRPDGEEIRFVDENVDQDSSQIERRVSMVGRNREKIYNWADSLDVTGEHIFDMDKEYLDSFEDGGAPTQDVIDRFAEEDIEIEQKLFDLDRNEYEEHIQEGRFTDEMRRTLEDEGIEFYDSVAEMSASEYEDYIVNDELVPEEFKQASGLDLSENATFFAETSHELYGELGEDDTFWIADMEYDNSTEELVIDDLEYKLLVSQGTIEILEPVGNLEQDDEDSQVWWILDDDETEYRMVLTEDSIEVYPYLVMSEDEGNWFIRAGTDSYRIEEEEDELIVYIVPEIRRERVNYARTLFGKADSDLLSPKPNPLNGEYIFKISFVSEDVEFNFGENSGRLVIMGSMYGTMGTDNRGRDIGAGWVWGARYALLLGAIIGGTTIALGTLFGMTSAYLGGWKDEFMQRINEIVIGIPILPILIIMMFIWRQSFWVMVFLMSILYWRGIAKTIRARGLQIRQATYVEASQALGAGSGRIITTHMIPQILPYSMAEGALLVPIVVITEASLSVLGLGDPNLVTWGKLLSQANGGGATIRGLWWWVLLPGIGITLLGFGFIASGMAIERIVNPKMKQR